MPAKTRKIPSYRLHKPTGQAIVRLAGRMHYLGTHGSDSSRQKYDQLIAEWLTIGRGKTTTTHNWTITQLVVAYMRHAEAYYVKNGKPTSEVGCIRSALKPLR
ncbi:MAG: site-specific integrase, partial [Pirellulales bacterium]